MNRSFFRSYHSLIFFAPPPTSHPTTSLNINSPNHCTHHNHPKSSKIGRSTSVVGVEELNDYEGNCEYDEVVGLTKNFQEMKTIHHVRPVGPVKPANAILKLNKKASSSARKAAAPIEPVIANVETRMAPAKAPMAPWAMKAPMTPPKVSLADIMTM